MQAGLNNERLVR